MYFAINSTNIYLSECKNGQPLFAVNPLTLQAGQPSAAKVLRRGVFERGTVVPNELPRRLGRVRLSRALAATWGRIFFGYFLLATQKKVPRQRRKYEAYQYSRI